MTTIVGDIGAVAVVVDDLGGAIAPLIADLQLAAQAAETGGSDDLSLDQAVTAPIVAGVLALNVAQSDTFRVDLTSDVTSVLLSGWPASGTSKRVAIWIVQDSIGGHVVDWPSAYKWSNGVAHAVSPAPGAIDCFVFVSFDGGATIFGNVVGLAYA